MRPQERPHIDPSMFVYCSIHSEDKNVRGERAGSVPAHYVRETYSYECWLCANEKWEATKDA